MKDEFDKWNEIKKNLETGLAAGPENFPKEREVWICILGKNIGKEQNGANEDFSRPILVIKKFNNDMFWTIALSTKQKDIDFYYNFTDPLSNEVSAILAQFRLMSIKRLTRKLYTLPDKIFIDIVKSIKELLPDG